MSKQGFAARCVFKRERAELFVSFLRCCSTLGFAGTSLLLQGGLVSPRVPAQDGGGWQGGREVMLLLHSAG